MNTVNEVSGSQISNKAKLKATNEKERIQLLRDHLKIYLVNKHQSQHTMKALNRSMIHNQKL